MQSGVTNEEIEVDLRLSVIKPSHATWLVSLYNHLTSCAVSAISRKDERKLALLQWPTGKYNSQQRIPSRIVSL